MVEGWHLYLDSLDAVTTNEAHLGAIRFISCSRGWFGQFEANKPFDHTLNVRVLLIEHDVLDGHVA